MTVPVSRARERTDVPERFRWNLADIYPDWSQWDAAFQDLSRQIDAFAALNAGQIDAVMLDTPIVLGAVEEGQVKDAEVVGQFKTGEVYGAVVNRDSKNLEAFNTAIKSMVDDGTRDKLFQQYFAEQAAVPEIPV